MSTSGLSRYVNGDSVIHKLNPRIKLIINILFIVLIFISNSFIYIGAILVLVFIAFLSTRLPRRQLISMFKTVIWISVFLFVINIFIITEGYGATAASGGGTRVDYNSTSSDGYFFESHNAWKIHINDKSILQTLFISARIYVMILVTTILTTTTKPTALTKAIEDLMWPLKLLFIPVNIIAMIISIALRFIPTLLGEAQRIMKAQASRGVDFKNGNLKSKAKSLVTLIIPLFVSAFAKAEDLGNAMETRGYDPYEKRTRYRSYPFRWFDLIFVIISLSITALIILTKSEVLATPWWWI